MVFRSVSIYSVLEVRILVKGKFKKAAFKTANINLTKDENTIDYPVLNEGQPPNNKARFRSLPM